MAESALAPNPQDAWAVHALAHALYEMARLRRAASTGCRRRSTRASTSNWFRNHLVWHLTLMQLSRGRLRRGPSRCPGRRSSGRRRRSRATFTTRSRSSGARICSACRSAPPAGAVRRDRAASASTARDSSSTPRTSAMALAGAGDWATAETPAGDAAGSAPPRTRRGSRARCSSRSSRASRPSRARSIERRSTGSSRSRRASSSSAGAALSGTSSTTRCSRRASEPATCERATRLLAARVARRPDHYWVRRQTSAA